jgi:hypothetical protein
MLGLRYLIYRGDPPAGFEPRFRADDYWVAENEQALPRAFVPGRVEYVSDPTEHLALLGLNDFDPRAIAYVASGAPFDAAFQLGSVEIQDELPGRIRLAADMQTAGLVVLADLWDAGWRASVDGRAAPVERVNHALRGVRVPAGESLVEMRYDPVSVRWGQRISAAAALALALWSAVAFWRMREDRARSLSRSSSSR